VGRRRKVYEISKFRSGSQGKQWNAIGVRVWGHDGALAEVEMKATKKARLDFSTFIESDDG